MEEGEVSAREEYERVKARDERLAEPWTSTNDAAEALIAELEAENARLRVCGTCADFMDGAWCVPYNETPYLGVSCTDSCRFDPPRWRPYWDT